MTTTEFASHVAASPNYRRTMAESKLPVIVDVGMYDGADTQYYLDTGHRVIAVEANPSLARANEKKFAAAIAEGRLTIVNRAVSPDGADVDLAFNPDNLGGSSIFRSGEVAGSVRVQGITIKEVLAMAGGAPKYLKIDIEGADGIAVRGVVPFERPEYLSFECGEDSSELLELTDHLLAVGYKRARVVEQGSFRGLESVNGLRDRAAKWVMRKLGYSEPRNVLRAGRWFASGHSSGPLPWLGDGKWINLTRAVLELGEFRRKNRRDLWYDLHVK